MRAKLTKTYRMSTDGIHIDTYEAGEIVEGRVAEAAMHDGAAKKVLESKPRKPKQTKPAWPDEIK